MARKRPTLFRGRHFEDVIILLCVRWYLRYSLTYSDLEEIVAEQNLSVDHALLEQGVPPRMAERYRLISVAVLLEFPREPRFGAMPTW